MCLELLVGIERFRATPRGPISCWDHPTPICPTSVKYFTLRQIRRHRYAAVQPVGDHLAYL